MEGTGPGWGCAVKSPYYTVIWDWQFSMVDHIFKKGEPHKRRITFLGPSGCWRGNCVWYLNSGLRRNSVSPARPWNSKPVYMFCGFVEGLWSHDLIFVVGGSVGVWGVWVITLCNPVSLFSESCVHILSMQNHKDGFWAPGVYLVPILACRFH